MNWGRKKGTSNFPEVKVTSSNCFVFPTNTVPHPKTPHLLSQVTKNSSKSLIFKKVDQTDSKQLAAITLFDVGLYRGLLFECCCESDVAYVCCVSEEVCKYHDSCRVRSRNHWRGLGPDRARQDCGDSEEDSQRWLTPPFLTFSWRSCKDTSFFLLGFFIPVLAWY